MADTILTADVIAQKALFHLKNELTFTKNVYSGYSEEYMSQVNGYKKGSAVRIAKPVKYRTKNGATLDLVDTVENNTTVTVDTQEHVALDFTGQELTLDVVSGDAWSERYLKGAVIALANKIDYDGMAEYKNVYNQVGTPGTTPSTYGVLADAALRLDEEAVPQEDRVSILTPKSYWGLADGELKGVFSENTVETLIRKGFVGKFARADFFMDQNTRTHTTGVFTTSATPLMNGSTAEGATTLVTNGWNSSSSTVKQGDVFTIDSVYAVNPVSGQSTGELRQFTVTADGTSAGGALTIAISPTIYSSAAGESVLPYQTIDTLPANDAALNFVGTEGTQYGQNLMYHPNAFACTMVPFATPQSAGQSVMWSTATDPDTGLSITFSAGWDSTNFKEIYRLDVLYGWDTIYPELACRITQ